MLAPRDAKIRLRNLADDATYAIGSRLIVYMNSIGETLTALVQSVIPNSNDIVALVPKRWDACAIVDGLRMKTHWPVIDICTERTEDETIIVNLDIVKRELIKLNPSAVLFIDFVVAGGGTAEKVAKELRSILPHAWIGFICVIGSDEINRARKYADWVYRIKESEVDRSVRPPRLKVWAILSDIGDRIREELLETPIEWERKRVAERLYSRLYDPFYSLNDLDEVRAAQFTGSISLLGAPLCFTDLAAIRYDYKNVAIEQDTWLSIIKIGQTRGVPYPIDRNWEIKKRANGWEHPYHYEVIRAIQEMKKYGFVREVEPFKYKPDVRFRKAYAEIIWPVVKEYRWSNGLREYAFDSLFKKRELKRRALSLIRKQTGGR